MSDDAYLEVYRREAYTYKAAYEDSLRRIAQLEKDVADLVAELYKDKPQSETPAEPDLTKTPSIAMKNEMREILGLEPLKPETKGEQNV